MKKLKKILLINWLYFSKEIIEVGDVNFLTGKNGAGKSTVIDALQIVLLGETNARNFNQAANEKSQRTLDGYLRADMDENNPYSRRGKDFSSYIACEFQDDVAGSNFVTGVVFDCRSDGIRQERFFIYVGTLPENGFVENGEAMEIPTLRRFLKQNYAKAEIYDTQKEYRRNMLSRWNVHNEQVLRMMKKAVSFRPIVDIQKFITENICDIPEKPDIEAMQQNIRDYKRHEMLNAKNRIAEIEQEFLQLNPEQHYFEEYYATYSDAPTESLDKLSSQKILALWMEFEQHAEHESRLGLLQKLSIMFRFNRNALKLFLRSPELVIPYLQSQFYSVKRRELEVEKQELNRKLEHYAFDAKMDELTQNSLRLFRAELATRYHWRNNRRCFEKNDFRRNSEEFTREYPVVLSTTYSIKGTLSIDHIYDYLIVDEASQVDLVTGVLAFSCARNIVIVGDLKQLPNVLTEDDIRTSDAIWQKYSLDERYRFSTHSLLSSALEIWQDAPVTLLREHYRCHPKIINFCNQKFYHGQLIVMTKDHDEPDVLTMYRTIAGNHARGHLNQRQIDVIQQEVLPRLHQQNFQSIGIITPYRDQVTAIRKQLGDTYEVDTVHKFQGREQDAIILTSVDNVITDFVDDPHMLNVAVSRAVHSLAVVTSQDPRNDQTNYGDLTRYIEYNNFEVIQSQVYSVFDMLYHGYAEQRRAYLQKHKRVSEYDSENLMYSVIQEVLSEEAFSSIGCAVHVSLATLVKNYEPLTEGERQYARNPLTHVDFLLFNQMDKQPVLAIEVDGTGFHEAGSKQAERDMKKNSILEKCGVPLLRLRTDGSGEKEKIKNALKGE